MTVHYKISEHCQIVKATYSITTIIFYIYTFIYMVHAAIPNNYYSVVVVRKKEYRKIWSNAFRPSILNQSELVVTGTMKSQPAQLKDVLIFGLASD